MYEANQSKLTPMLKITPIPRTQTPSLARASPDTRFYQQILQNLSRSDVLCSCDVEEMPFGIQGPLPTQLCTFCDVPDIPHSPSKLLSEHKPCGVDTHLDCIWLLNSLQTGFTATGFHFAPLEMWSTK